MYSISMFTRTNISKDYEDLGSNQVSMQRFEYFKGVCQQFNGDYALLWHNSYFQNNKSKRHYDECIK